METKSSGSRTDEENAVQESVWTHGTSTAGTVSHPLESVWTHGTGTAGTVCLRESVDTWHRYSWYSQSSQDTKNSKFE